VTCNATTLSSLPANQRSRKFDRVALDFQHNTVAGGQHYQGEPAKVAGFATPVVIEGEGIVLTDIEWTAEGIELASGGHYPDISPAVIRNDAGEVVFLHSVGLVRQGEVDGVTLFSAAALQPLLETFESTNPTKEKDPVYKDLLLTLLGLPADASDEQIKTAATEQAAAKEDSKPAPEKIDAMSAQIADLLNRLTAIESARSSDERTQLIERASREGKVIPLSADELSVTPISVLKTLVDKTPATVPLLQRTGRVTEFSANLIGSGIDAEIRKNLGISEDAWKKYNS
jgi:phage I-like protein